MRGYAPDLLTTKEEEYGDYLEFSVDITGNSGLGVNSILLGIFENNVNF